MDGNLEKPTKFPLPMNLETLAAEMRKAGVQRLKIDGFEVELFSWQNGFTWLTPNVNAVNAAAAPAPLALGTCTVTSLPGYASGNAAGGA